MSAPPAKKKRASSNSTSPSSKTPVLNKPDVESWQKLYTDDNDADNKQSRQIERRFKHDKHKKKKRKEKVRFLKDCKRHDDIYCDNISKESFHFKSPHVILSNKIFNDIKQNVIMLTKPRIEGESRDRLIYYDIKYMSDNIVMNKKSRYYNLKPSCTKGNVIYILIAIQEVIHFDHLVFFTEKGKMIPCLSMNEDRHGYVLLAIIKVKKNWQKLDILMPQSNHDLVKKFYINQIKNGSGSYHFGTSGTIYGLGYGPKFHKNQYGHSIDRYSNSK